MKKNSKGFTLLELMAVIIVLITLTLIALFAINKQIERSAYNAFIKDANQIAHAAESKFSDDVDKAEDGIYPSDLYNGTLDGKVCYSIRQALNEKYVTKDDKTTYQGSIEVCYGDDCTYDFKLWLTDGIHFIDGKTKFDKRTAVSNSFASTSHYLSCGIETTAAAIDMSQTNTFDYDFTHTQEIFEVHKTGVYAIEAWGAQGGGATGEGSGYFHNDGGFGGYTYAEYKLEKGQILYVKVGGKGEDYVSDAAFTAGGYNGGRDSKINWNFHKGGGGGASSVTLKPFDANNLKVAQKDILAIAGGGEGSLSHINTGRGSSGGGYCDGRGNNCNFATRINNEHQGQGGGYFMRDSSGGTGYFYPNKAKNAVMYTYNGYTNSAADKKTLTTQDYSDDPVSNTAKRGNGFIRITYIGNFS